MPGAGAAGDYACGAGGARGAAPTGSLAAHGDTAAAFRAVRKFLFYRDFRQGRGQGLEADWGDGGGSSGRGQRGTALPLSCNYGHVPL